MSGRRWGAGLGIAALAIAAAVGAGGCEGRPRTVKEEEERPRPMPIDVPALAELDLTKGLPEATTPSLFGPGRQRTHLDLVRVLDGMKGSDATKGVFVRLGTTRLGLGRAHEAGRMLAEIRAKVPVVCHADDYNNTTLLLAALGCSKIYLSPAGSVDSVGIAAQLLFGKSLLEKLHVDVDFLQVGKFKGASEPFTRDGPSPEARESLERALKGMRAAWLEAIQRGRGKSGIAELAEDGPFAAEEAKQKGLIDEVGYADEAREDAKKLASADRIAMRFGAGEGPPPVSRGMVDLLRALSGASKGGTPHVAVVRAVGAISMSAAPSLLGGSEGITEQDLGRTVAKLTSDESTKAVVLRIDSPGGSALASDLLWKRLMKLRAEKPIVVSVGGMAASGGYYLACTGTKIMAEPTSIIGSMGVVGGKFGVGKALGELGVHAETIAAAPGPERAARAAYLSPFTAWDDATRAKMLASMTAIYDLFLKRVSEGRGIPVEQVAPSAEGQLFAGLEAKDRMLIDQIGGLDAAIKLALELAKLPDDAPVEAVGEAPGFFDLLDGNDANEAEGRSDAARRAGAAAAAEVLLPDLAALSPEAQTFVASALPALSGERALAALPFALTVR